MGLRLGVMGLALVGLMVMSGSAVGATAPSETTADSGDKMVCKFRARTGTRFATKICRTMMEWEAIAEANRIAFAETQNRPNPNVGCPNQNAGSSPATMMISGSC